MTSIKLYEVDSIIEYLYIKNKGKPIEISSRLYDTKINDLDFDLYTKYVIISNSDLLRDTYSDKMKSLVSKVKIVSRFRIPYLEESDYEYEPYELGVNNLVDGYTKLNDFCITNFNYNSIKPLKVSSGDKYLFYQSKSYSDTLVGSDLTFIGYLAIQLGYVSRDMIYANPKFIKYRHLDVWKKIEGRCNKKLTQEKFNKIINIINE